MSRHPSMPDYPASPGYPPPGDHQAAPGHPGYPPAPGAPAIDHDEYGEDYQDPAPDEHGGDGHGLAADEYGVVYDEYGEVHQAPAGDPGEAHLRAEPAAPQPGIAPRSRGSAARTAMLAYLTVPLFGFVVPLVVYLRTRRGPGWTRAHAAQALNVWITVALYDLSAAIMGTMLSLDSPQIALIVFGPLVVGLWLVALTLLVRAATAASQGRDYAFPGWLCSRIVR
jgi:uncharacterized protein